MTKAEQRLWDAAKTGQYPLGTTAQNLTSAKNINGYSALHSAAWSGHYPPGTTVHDLTNAKNNSGYSALHHAAWSGQYPSETTAQHLAYAKDKTGYSALHHAARTKHLPPDTTIALLKTTKDNNGTSAWDSLCNYLNYNPACALDRPPHLFQEDSEFAITTVQAAIKKDPSLQSQAAIWLSKVLAGDQTQRDRTTTTPYTSP